MKLGHINDKLRLWNSIRKSKLLLKVFYLRAESVGSNRFSNTTKHSHIMGATMGKNGTLLDSLPSTQVRSIRSDLPNEFDGNDRYRHFMFFVNR